jgi:ureidoglycolate lyase
MYQIKVQQLSPEKFRKYGVYQNLLDNASLAENSIIPQGFFADLLTLDFGSTTLPTVSVCHVKKAEKNIIAFLEAHKYTCEGLLPIDADVVIFVGSPLGEEMGKFSVKQLEAFYVPKGTFVKLNPLIVHGSQYVVDAEEAHILCMLPGRTFNNDMIPQPLDAEEQAEIVM